MADDIADSFEVCVCYATHRLGIDFPLKEKQREILKHIYNGHDCIAVLPTGYGKSLVFQMLPFFLQGRVFKNVDFDEEDLVDIKSSVPFNEKKISMSMPAIAIVITPLNAIMEEQVEHLCKKGVSACHLAYGGRRGISYEKEPDSDSSDEEEAEEIKSVSTKEIEDGKFCIIYAHPETIIESKIFSSLLRSPSFQEKVCAVVVDEVHMVIEWGEKFRPSFKRLGEITCLLPDVSHLAVTATATPKRIKELSQVLQYENPQVVSMNPDRKNIFLEVRDRKPNIRKYEKLNEMIHPLAEELKRTRTDFPLTIMYMENLESVGYCYQYVSHELGDDQYEGANIPENRLFGQYHKDYTDRMKRHIVNELGKEKPTLRLVLATVALGMGLNAPSVQQIIHCRPPTSVESYMQEIGRAGRAGQSASAILYFNKSDIASSRKDMSEDMMKYCKHDKCLRLFLVRYFGFNEVTFDGDKNDCCGNCRKG